MGVAQHSHKTASTSHCCLQPQTNGAVSEELGFCLSGVELGLDLYLGHHPLEEGQKSQQNFGFCVKATIFSARERAKKQTQPQTPLQAPSSALFWLARLFMESY